MRHILKQSTAHIFRIGPFVDDVDGATAEVALIITRPDIQISKNGTGFSQTSALVPVTTHDTDGWYQCPLTVLDTDTLGTLTVQVTMVGALPVWQDFTVVAANVYDSLVGGTDLLDVSIVGLAGAGADSVTLTIKDETWLPIADADVWISTDAAGLNVVAGTVQTNDVGKYTFQLDAGLTYYCWRQKAGMNFENPKVFVAIAD